MAHGAGRVFDHAGKWWKERKKPWKGDYSVWWFKVTWTELKLTVVLSFYLIFNILSPR